MVKEIYGVGADVSKEVFKIDLWSEEATYNNLKGCESSMVLIMINHQRLLRKYLKKFKD